MSVRRVRLASVRRVRSASVRSLTVVLGVLAIFAVTSRAQDEQAPAAEQVAATEESESSPATEQIAAMDEPASAEAPHAPQPGEVQTFGPDDQRIYVVDHTGTWSMHAESVAAGVLLRGWHEAGGPLVTSKVILDYPFTLSLHRVTAERILERVLEGYSYTLHYDAKGRLEAVRVYSPEPQRNFKTPRLVESFAAWKLLETSAPAAAASSPGNPPGNIAPAGANVTTGGNALPGVNPAPPAGNAAVGANAASPGGPPAQDLPVMP